MNKIYKLVERFKNEIKMMINDSTTSIDTDYNENELSNFFYLFFKAKSTPDNSNPR